MKSSLNMYPNITHKCICLLQSIIVPSSCPQTNSLNIHHPKKGNVWIHSLTASLQGEDQKTSSNGNHVANGAAAGGSAIVLNWARAVGRVGESTSGVGRVWHARCRAGLNKNGSSRVRRYSDAHERGAVVGTSLCGWRRRGDGDDRGGVSAWGLLWRRRPGKAQVSTDSKTSCWI